MVKTERLEFVIEILTSVMNHWIFFPLVMTALGIAMKLAEQPLEGNPDFLLWAVCGLIPIAFFLVRYYVERFWLFMLCHGAVLAAALAAASLLSIGGAVTCVVCTAAYVIYSFMLRLKENETVYSGNIHPVTALGISVVANFMFHREDHMPDWDRYYLFIMIGVFACYLIIHYLKHYLSFLQVNKSSAGYLPAREILHSGIGFVLPYTLIGALILVLSLNVKWLEPILRVLKEGLKIVLRFLIGLLPAGEEPGELVPIEEPVRGNNDPGLGELPAAETFWLWEVLEYVVIILFFCGCAYVLFKAVKWLIRYIREKFGDRADYAGIVTGQADVYDVRERCSIEKKDSASRGGGLFQRFSPVERVRRLYKKRVLSGKTAADDRSGLNYMTARECGDKLSLPDMADIYEQARYSDREITAADVKRMKLACSGQTARN
ncbi:MAG: hypothetical protein NC121_15600 [Blautia sp.]|nr:hypothetical protein [Blautia sp.]